MFKKLNIKKLNTDEDINLKEEIKTSNNNKQYLLTDYQNDYNNFCGECINFNHFSKRCQHYNIGCKAKDISCVVNFKSIY